MALMAAAKHMELSAVHTYLHSHASLRASHRAASPHLPDLGAATACLTCLTYCLPAGAPGGDAGGARRVGVADGGSRCTCSSRRAVVGLRCFLGCHCLSCPGGCGGFLGLGNLGFPLMMMMMMTIWETVTAKRVEF